MAESNNGYQWLASLYISTATMYIKLILLMSAWLQSINESAINACQWPMASLRGHPKRESETAAGGY